MSIHVRLLPFTLCLLSCAALAPGCAMNSTKDAGETPPAELLNPEVLANEPPEDCGGSDSLWLETTLAKDPRLESIVARAQEFRLQILVGEIVQEPGERPCIREHGFRVDAEYFYPASAIKMVAATGALQELEELNRLSESSITVDTPLDIGRLELPPSPGSSEPMEVSPGALGVTLRTLLHDALVESDNPAYSRLIDFAGMHRLNSLMWTAGLSQTRVRQRFGIPNLTPESNLYAPEVHLSQDGAPVLLLPERRMTAEIPPLNLPGTIVGHSYFDWKVRRAIPFLEDPKTRNEMREKNYASLRDLQRLLTAIVDPELQSDRTDIALSDDHRRLLRTLMSEQPDPVEDVPYAEVEAYHRPLLPGIQRVIPDRDRILYINKMGQAFGFYIDCAYIEDLQTGKRFFVAATIHTNANGVLNDDAYEYTEIANPMMADLGEVLATTFLSEASGGPQ